MALRKRVRLVENGVPADLFDLDSPVWQSQAAYDVWLDRHDLHARGETPGPVSRHHEAAVAYAISIGHFRTYGASTYEWADLSWLVAEGVPVNRRRRENSTHARMEALMREMGR